MNVVQKLKFAMGRAEKVVGKEENAGYQHFLLFPQCFQKATFSGSLKVGICTVNTHQDANYIGSNGVTL